jgi:hypothetical protein
MADRLDDRRTEFRIIHAEAPSSLENIARSTTVSAPIAAKLAVVVEIRCADDAPSPDRLLKQ